MSILYDLIISYYYLAIKIAAFFGNAKAILWIKGRKFWYANLEKALISNQGKERFWFHCASLGEFEQGRALIEKVRKEFPEAFILLTFFSPSGYEIRKKYPDVNFVSYLPLDTKKNAKLLIKLLNPSKTIFIKYEFWYHYINELSKSNKPMYVVSAIFRPQQIFFKWYGSFYRGILKKITHIFLQDRNSLHLLSDKGFVNCSIAGDTRFDRVFKIAQEAKPILLIDEFIGNQKSIVAGSTWPGDEDILLKIFYGIEDFAMKLIIVPHEVTPERIKQLQNKILNEVNSQGVCLYSDKILNKNASIMIVDTIGILSSAYKYATITWVGGGFDNGIHNILEPAAHGKPIFFGPEYQKFKEAHELIACQCAFSIKNVIDGKRLLKKLTNNLSLLQSTGIAASNYVRNNIGATDRIFHSIFLKLTEKEKTGTQQTIKYKFVSMKKKIIISIGILVIAGAAFGFYLFNKPHQSILDETPDFEVASSTIIGEFEKNEDAANKKFNGKIVEVVGIISEISKDEQGKLNITLQGQDIAGIGCVFEKAAQLKAAALIEGQEVRIKGICAGILMDVVLVDCVVVDKNN